MNYTSTMQFIELFRQHRALWDRYDVNYLNKMERMRQREEIGYSMGMTEVDVGKKICNLRTYYLREMVKRDKALQYGQETAETYIPKWPYFDALDTFLQDVVRKKRNEYLTAGGAYPEVSFIYAADDHLSDDATDDLPNDNDLSRDSHLAGDVGSGEGRRPPLTTNPTTTTTTTTNNNNNDTTIGSNDSDNDLPPKRPKLEPEEDFPTAVLADGEDGVARDKDRSGLGPDSPGSCLGVGVPFPRSSPYRVPPSLLSTSHVAQSGPSLPRFGAARGPPNSAHVLANASSNAALGMEGSRMNGHSLGGGGTVGGAQGSHSGSHPRVPAGMMVVEEDEDWLFGRYIAAELKKVKSFKDKQLTKMRIQQIVTYAQLGMGDLSTPTSGDV
ncbi:uncharacterized protein LOC143290234 [Babylonia areolata]|uniref:uncharacterized protein LOC143290234 n=1 Tax=Babylonia areolata TaxID=304850 RepID=UPI003FD50E09